jgi:hypothetical protein
MPDRSEKAMKKSICIIDNGGEYSDHEIIFVECSPKVAKLMVEIVNGCSYESRHKFLGEAKPGSWKGGTEEPGYLLCTHLILKQDQRGNALPELTERAKRLPKKLLLDLAKKRNAAFLNKALGLQCTKPSTEDTDI